MSLSHRLLLITSYYHKIDNGCLCYKDNARMPCITTVQIEKLVLDML